MQPEEAISSWSVRRPEYSVGGLSGALAGLSIASGLELIVVDDGSTDGTADLLASYAKRDRRLRVVRQENAGLTAALVRGCAAARAEFIARHDAGDISHEDRLARQVAALEARPDAVMVACATRFIAPEGEPLHCVTFDDEKIAANLGDLDGRQHIPHHGSAMMRRRIYEKVGGYRTLFPVAQDYDLWTRLFEQGACLGLTQELYSARLMPGSISATRRGLQEESSRVIAMAARSRREGGSEQPILDEWFHHFHKAGGTTMVNLAVANGERLPEPHHNGNPVDERGEAIDYTRMSVEELASFTDRCVAQHITFVASEFHTPDFDYLAKREDVVLVTIVRDPLSRYLSNYNFDRYFGFNRAEDLASYPSGSHRAMCKPNYYCNSLLGRHIDPPNLTEADTSEAQRRLALFDHVIRLGDFSVLANNSLFGWPNIAMRANTLKRSTPEMETAFRAENEPDYALLSPYLAPATGKVA